MPDYAQSDRIPSTSTCMSGTGETSIARVAERRRRGEISCAECRRLKMRCDRKVPCKPCVRRGCAHLCPEGTNITADGPRFVLAATNHLHDDISGLRDRIRVLESALGSMHYSRTQSTHPLLRSQPEDDWEDDQFRGVNYFSEVEDQRARHQGGTLVSGGDGTTRFFGSFDNAQVHVMSGESEQAHTTGEQYLGYDVEFTRCNRHFPIEPVPAPNYQNVLSQLRRYIPMREIFDPLLDTVYVECGRAWFSAFTPDYVEQSLIPAALYGEGQRVPGPGESPEVGLFGRLSGAAMGAAGVLAHPALELIESLYARSMLEILRQNTREEIARSTLSLACRMCYDLGLHMDGTGWRKLTDKELERRKAVFWMTFTCDVLESYVVGRPTAMTFDSVYIDIELPNTCSDSASRNVFNEYARMAMVFAEISFVIQSLAPSAYSRILDLDEKVRGLFASADLSRVRPVIVPPSSLVYVSLHRAFFLRALTEHPDDPFKSEYYSSVHAVLRGARESIAWMSALLEGNPASCARLHHVWAVARDAAEIYTNILERAPHCPQAQDVQLQLDKVISLLVKGAKYGSARAKHSLSVVRARMENMESAGQGVTQDILSYSSPSSLPKNEFPTSVKADPNKTVPSLLSSNTARTLKKSASLSSFPRQSKSEDIQISSTRDDSFYPSYLRRHHPVPTSHQSDSLDEFDTMLSVPISRSLVERIPPELPGSGDEFTHTAALWESASWETIGKAPLDDLSPVLAGSFASPPEKSSASELNAIVLGGG